MFRGGCRMFRHKDLQPESMSPNETSLGHYPLLVLLRVWKNIDRGDGTWSYAEISAVSLHCAAAVLFTPLNSTISIPGAELVHVMVHTFSRWSPPSLTTGPPTSHIPELCNLQRTVQESFGAASRHHESNSDERSVRRARVRGAHMLVRLQHLRSACNV